MTTAAGRICTLHQASAPHPTSEVAGTVAVVAAIVVIVLLMAMTRAARIAIDLMSNALRVAASMTTALVTMVIVTMIALVLLIYR